MEAAVTIGVRPPTIILRHVIANLLGVVIVYATLLVPAMIIYESFISFLGLGVQEPDTSWGALINDGAGQMPYGTLWQLFFPCLSGYHPHPLYVVCLLGLQARAGAGALRRRSG